MRFSAMRLALFAAMVAGTTVLLCCAFAWPGSATPWAPATVRELPLADFGSGASQVGITEHGVRAEGADAGGATVLMQSVAGLDTAGYRYFRFDLDRIPTTSQAVFVWQQAGATRLAALPDSPGARGTLDLSLLPEWKGPIDAIGVALLPTDYLAPTLVQEPVFELRAARLESVSWKGALGALWSRWSAYRPWNGRSNHTGGMELTGRFGASLQLFAAAWSLLALALTAGVLGRDVARRVALPVFACAALALAMYQVRQLSLRANVARASASAAARDPSHPLSALPALATAAIELNARINAENLRERVLVSGSNEFLSEYPVWLLRAQNAATLQPWQPLPAQEALAGSLLVLAGGGDGSFDEASGQLRVADQTRSATLFHDAGVLKAYRFTAPEAAP